jgi:hypothetical protein
LDFRGKDAARNLGIEVAKLEIQRTEDIAPAFEALQRQADALYVVGTFISMIRSDDALPFNERTAQRLMKISEHPVLTNTTHESHLPTSWTTLYELSKASPALLEAKISTGTITPRLERSQVARKIFGKIPKAAQHTLDRVKQLRGELDAAQAYIAELEAARDAETAPPLTPGPGPETEPVNPEPVEAEVGQPQPEAERPVALATDTVPIAPTETADDETEPDEEEDLEPTAEETLTNAIESVELLLDKLFDEEIIYRLAEVDLDKRDALLSRLRAGLNRRVDAIERAPVLDKADAIAALPESVKAYFRMHGRVSNCDVRWYINRFPALNKLEDSERRAIADKLIRDMLQCGELIKVSRKRDVYEIAGSPAHAYNAGYAPRRE